VASCFVRQISSPFTTRLALVFASWADENIIRIETVQDAFVASLQRIFFFLTSKKLLNNCLKCLKCLKRLKRPEVLLGTFGQSKGTEQWPHATTRLLREAVSWIPARFCPLCIKGTCGRKNMSKIFRTKFGRNAQNGIGRSSAISCPMEETERSIVPAKSYFLVQDDPDSWSAVHVRS
jgi:hypothetical protein